jgi:beta-galactosidase
MFQKVLAAGAFLLFVLSVTVFAETYTLEQSNRIKINFGARPWKMIKGSPQGAKDSAFNDAAWRDVGIPNCVNDSDTFINEKSGGGDGSFYNGNTWYRRHFTLDSKLADRKFFFEFEGCHYAAAVYVNGHFIPGNSAYNPKATHVIGFVGFVVDATPYLHFNGTDNVLAVYVCKTQEIYSDCHFSGSFRFGQGSGGMFRPVWLHITDKVHVPLNVYSVLNNWGTYIATTAASPTSATVRIQTNVQNENTAAQAVTLTVKVVDATNQVVFTEDKTQSITAGQTYMFDQTATIANPHLWYPNASSYGGPYMYKVFHIVKVGGKTVDVFQSPLGIRTITWDADYPYINGKQHFLWGAAGRYDYPALGTAVPEEQQWRDVKLVAACNGRLWRPGHSSCSPEYVAACDAFGVMLIQPSGEGEGAFSTGGLAGYSDPAYVKGLKSELHRDMIVRDRNNPCVLAWEATNGPIDPGFNDQLRNLAKQWDPITPRVQATRGDPFAIGDLGACTMTGCEIGVKNAHPGTPAWGAEAWGRGCLRASYDFELKFIEEYIQNWKNSIRKKCFGLVQWYLAEECGENGPLIDGTGADNVRSIGTAMMDNNRFPKLLYNVYKVAWDTTKPNIVIAHHWNRAGNVRVNVFCNTDSVRLFVNGNKIGTKARNPWYGSGDDQNIGQNNTEFPFQCYFDNVPWQAGTLRAEGINTAGQVLCFDEKKTAGAPAAVKLTVEPALVKPNGEAFKITANGTDAAFITATVVDANGIWCPTATNDITFAITSGVAEYRGGSAAILYNGGVPRGLRAPLDPTLPAEGGLTKVAIRSKFTPGTVTVNATAAGLTAGTASFTIYPVSDTVGVQGVPSVTAATISGQQPRIALANNAIKYFIGEPGDVSIQILNAGGKVVKRIAQGKQSPGWHPVSCTAGSVFAKGNGVYFIRLTVNGTNRCVQRMLMVR